MQELIDLVDWRRRVGDLYRIGGANPVDEFRMRRDANPLMLMALFLACSIAAVPYMLSYDTLGLTFQELLLLGAGSLDGAGRRFVQLVYWLPLIQMVFGNWHIPGPALIAPAFAIYALTRLRVSPASARTFDAMSITAR